MPHWPLALETRQAAYGQWIGEAIGYGDLGLANDLVKDVNDPAVHVEVQKANNQRRSQQRKKWLTRMVILAMICLVIGATFIGFFIVRNSQVRELGNATALAADLIAESSANESQDIWRLYRAAGLNPDAPGLLPRLSAVVETKLKPFLAIRNGRQQAFLSMMSSKFRFFC